MTPQDMQALEAFLSQLTQARVDARDPQAAAMIGEAAARQPDAAYLLVQRAMLLDRALQNAQAQIASLQNQLQAAQFAQGNGNRSFVDNDNAWGASAGRAPQATPAQMPPQAPYPAYPASQVPQYQAPQQPAPQPARTGFLGGGLGGTLGTIATTAAGVAGGAMLFQGIENLFHRGGGGGFLGGGQALTGGQAPSETIVNNYYGDDNVGSAGSNNRDNSLLADNGNLDNGLDNYVNDTGSGDDYQNDDSFF